MLTRTQKRKRESKRSKNKALITTLIILAIGIGLFATFTVVNGNMKNKEKTENTNAVDEENTKEKEESNNEVDENKSEVVARNKEVGGNLINYTGTVEHIFFHPLVAYNSRAFDGDSKSKGMDDSFLTVKEFRAVLNQLYKNNFILININALYEEQTLKNGTTSVKRKELLLPEGTKPIIISIDDMNYYNFMIGNGTVSKLVLDSNEEVSTFSMGIAAKTVVSRENEIIPILDDFVKEHPDFSLNNAKGIIGLTGYQGILGYRTNIESNNRESEIQDALKVVNRLKENGWVFASHGYGHPNIIDISNNELVEDNTKWKNEVGNLVGDTNIYLYPYESGPEDGNENLKYLQNQGFKIFCGVGSTSSENILKSGGVITNRRNIDGVSLKTKGDEFSHLYKYEEVLDSEGRRGID